MSDGPYAIIPAQSGHLPALPAIELAAAKLFPPEDLPPGAAQDTTPVEVLAAAAQEQRLWVAVDSDGVPVGFALVDLVDSHAHLEELDVHPEHGRQGIGRRLVETIIDWARNVHKLPITLTTFRHLPWNAPFYERLGFEGLPPDEMTPTLQNLVAGEQRSGLDGAKRLVMIYR